MKEENRILHPFLDRAELRQIEPTCRTVGPVVEVPKQFEHILKVVVNEVFELSVVVAAPVKAVADTGAASNAPFWGHVGVRVGCDHLVVWRCGLQDRCQYFSSARTEVAGGVRIARGPSAGAA